MMPQWLRIALAGGLVFLAAMLIADWAKAHTAPSGWVYPDDCCNGDECDPIPADRVTKNPDGTYSVTVYPGDHPKITTKTTFNAIVQIRASGDNEYHLCAMPWTAYCLFLPFSM